MIIRPQYGMIGLGAALSMGACSEPRVSRGDVDSDRHGIECALGGAETFTKACYFESSSKPENTIQLIRHPDGGFRVFESGETHSGLVTRDGADEVVETVVENKLIVTVGKDRYRFDMPGFR